MDLGDVQNVEEERGESEEIERHRRLPKDLPKSLDDRHYVHSYGGETEMYDAWQGMK